MNERGRTHTLFMVIETVHCAHCGSANLRRDGKAPNGKEKKPPKPNSAEGRTQGSHPTFCHQASWTRRGELLLCSPFLLVFALSSCVRPFFLCSPFLLVFAFFLAAFRASPRSACPQDGSRPAQSAGRRSCGLCPDTPTAASLPFFPAPSASSAGSH